MRPAAAAGRGAEVLATDGPNRLVAETDALPARLIGRAAAERYGGSVPRPRLHYTAPMRSDAQADFEITDDDTDAPCGLRDVDCGGRGAFPVHSGK